MENDETLNEICFDSCHQMPKTSRLAVISLVFGILGPFSAGAMWVASFNNFLTIGNPRVMALFSCIAAWILGLILGTKSLGQIDSSQGQLTGKEYANVGIATSALWMVVILASILLPAIFYVNS
ncbi:MAG: hypothetical protein ACYTEQ_15930 [Planctomycetota bacterium]|jgi:hypothetical protein